MIEVSDNDIQEIRIRFNTAYYRYSTVEQITHHLSQTIRQLCIASSKTTIGELNFIPLEEADMLINEKIIQ